jgi:hypothetical protein
MCDWCAFTIGVAGASGAGRGALQPVVTSGAQGKNGCLARWGK